MIEICSDITEFDFLPSDPFCAKITAYAKTYKFNTSFAFFWVVKDQDYNPIGAIGSIENNAVIYCNDKFDDDELIEFLKIMKFSSISLSKELCERLNLISIDDSYIVKFNNKIKTECDIFKYEEPNYRKAYEILNECDFQLPSFELFRCDLAARINSNTAQIEMVPAENPVSIAMAMFVGNNSVLLGGVGTLPQCRKYGFATQAIITVINKQNKDCYLFCRNDSLLGFYQKIGFKPTGRWCIACLPE